MTCAAPTSSRLTALAECPSQRRERDDVPQIKGVGLKRDRQSPLWAAGYLGPSPRGLDSELHCDSGSAMPFEIQHNPRPLGLLSRRPNWIFSRDRRRRRRYRCPRRWTAKVDSTRWPR